MGKLSESADGGQTLYLVGYSAEGTVTLFPGGAGLR